jgi:CHAT domain-containing protein/cytochrome c-type biogenesis protein CcmH/NrfG
MPERHLSPAEVQHLRGSGGLDAPPGEIEDSTQKTLVWARRHVEDCRLCKLLVRASAPPDTPDAFHEVAETLERLRVPLSARGDAPFPSSCPEPSRFRELAAGLVSDPEAGALHEHSVRCDACVALLRMAVEDLVVEATEEEIQDVSRLRTASPEWQRALATRLVATPAASIPHGRVRSRSRSVAFFAVATAALLALLLPAGAWVVLRSRAPSLDRLLADAYSERRTIELRAPGAEYAPMRGQREPGGSALAKPASLLRAEYLIKDQLERNPDDAALLAARGRAALLEWSYEEAIVSFQESLDILPEQADVLRDLATAYFERAEVEKRPTDYGQTIEYLGRALARAPNDTVALFNRAIASERLFAYAQAIADWETYLRLDPDGEWADEARSRLEAVRRQVERSQSQGAGVSESAAAAADALESRLLHRLSGNEWPDSYDEVYIDLALTRWLPALTSVDRDASRRALVALAAVLQEEHRDDWLADVLSQSGAPATPESIEGFRLLASAIASNASGGFDEAARSAGEARNRFDAGNCPACRLRAAWEEAYAMQRTQRGEPCLAEADASLRDLPPKYAWLQTQLQLEKSVCALMVGEMDVARKSALEALRTNRRSGYSTQLLRSLQFAGNAVGREDSELAWTYFREGLERHWAGAYRPARAYLFYSEMSYPAEAAGDWHLATVLLREAVTHVTRTPNRLVEAMNRHSLAVSAQFAGDAESASGEFLRAGEIFSSLPATELTRSFHFSAETYQASLESQRGEAALALARLRGLSAERPDTADLSQYWIWLHYFQALGEAELQEGSPERAEPALRAAAYISEQALGTLVSDTDRALWERRTGRVYRALVELELEKRGDPEGALEIVEWYRAAPLRERSRDASATIRFADLASGPPLPASTLVARDRPQLRGETVLSFARLSSGVYAWAFDDRGLRSVRIEADPDELERATRRFARLCADPSSDLDELHRVGARLYQWLVAPFDEQLTPDRTLVVEPDDVLNGIPFQALLTPGGEYLGESFRVAYSPGLGFWTRPSSGGSFRERRALVVGTSSERRVFGRLLLPLPQAETEARAVASSFRDPILRLGESATLGDIATELSSARVFHFSGHAVATATRNGLLLASAPGSDPEGEPAILDADGLARLDLRSLDLVVLSACSTATVQGALQDPRGLARAFLRRGVPHVVASRWAVDSGATEELVESFYAHLGTNAVPTDALEAAAEELRARPRTSHPYYWAGFSVYGRS